MLRRSRANIAVFLMGALALAATAPVFAAHPAPATPLNIDWNSSGSSHQGNPNEQRGHDALREVGNAQSEISKTYWTLRREFENSVDWQDAVNAAHRAHASYDVARINALSLLQATPDYKKAEQELWKAQQALSDAKSRQPDSPHTANLASELLRRKSILTSMETECVESDEKLRQARYAFIDADARAAALQRTFMMLVRTDPRWIEARSKLDRAREQLASIGR
jgi:hypothetical protein